MADRIVILNEGRIEQEGPPEEVYNAPATPFVAKFMGAENVVELDARVASGGLEVLAGPSNETARLARPAARALLAGADGGSARLDAFFRSEAAELLRAEDNRGGQRPDQLVLSGTVSQVSYPGGAWRHTVRIGGRDIYVDAPVKHAPPMDVRVRLPGNAVFLFSRAADRGSDQMEGIGEGGAAAFSARQV
jgi:ABC-type Fe3+/spermidine/putrescine transport system ATPase subunit